MDLVNASTDNDLLDALFLPITGGELAWPRADRVLFLRAIDGTVLRRFDAETLVCEQSFKPDALQLVRSGLTQTARANERFALVLVRLPRSRNQARALFAQAIHRATNDGVVVAAAANNQGARALQDDLERLAGPATVLSKHKCRVFRVPAHSAHIDAALLNDWMQLDAPYPIGHGLLGRAGVFSADAIDPASQLLAEHLPWNLAGCAADLGAGGGYLAIELVTRNPGIHAIDLYEAEARALEVARLNLPTVQRPLTVGFHWHDVRTGLPSRYDVIISNPPFHHGRADAPELGHGFIIAAANALNPSGQLWLVANRHLPYEAVLGEHFAQVRVVVVRDGFKVIAAQLSW
ncbi:MAG: class I SAM-dependent methyltransferase [Xanthomonadales bacterium]|nr:class I SAM-dependent methyltransferase [Xanthomonadales bacterium]